MRADRSGGQSTHRTQSFGIPAVYAILRVRRHPIRPADKDNVHFGLTVCKYFFAKKFLQQ